MRRSRPVAVASGFVSSITRLPTSLYDVEKANFDVKLDGKFTLVEKGSSCNRSIAAPRIAAGIYSDNSVGRLRLTPQFGDNSEMPSAFRRSEMERVPTADAVAAVIQKLAHSPLISTLVESGAGWELASHFRASPVAGLLGKVAADSSARLSSGGSTSCVDADITAA